MVVWLLVSFWYDAYLQWSDASRILRSERVANELIAAKNAIADERSQAPRQVTEITAHR